MSELRDPVHLRGRGLSSLRRSSFPCVSTQGGCLSQGTLAVLSTPHLPSTLVSRLLEKLSAHSRADAGLKLSVTQSAAHQFSHLWKARAWGPLPLSPLFPADINLPHSWLASPSLCSDGRFYVDAPHHLPFIPTAYPITLLPPPGWTTLCVWGGVPRMLPPCKLQGANV